MVWSAFEIIGTIAFAISGVLVGIEKKMDVFGVVTLSMTVAVGGGVIRDVLIGQTPPTAFRDPTFIAISLLAAVGAIILCKHLSRFSYFIQLFDAIGLGAFTATGASLVPAEHYTLFMAVSLGVITSTGGGILRDLLAQRAPLVFHQEIYAVASIIGAAVWYVGSHFFSGSLPLYLCFIVTLAIRLFSLRYNLHLPKVGSEIAVSQSEYEKQ